MALIDLPPRPRVLVLRALGLGDLLTGVPALRALRRGLPEADIMLACPAPLEPLVRLTGAVDRLLPTPDLADLDDFDQAPDLGVNLHGRGPQSLLGLRRTGARRILSHAHPQLPEIDGPAWDPDQHEVRRWCRLLRWAGLRAEPTDLRLEVPPVDPTVAGAVVVHPGAASPARRWPVTRFAMVAAGLARQGHRVVVTGNGAEQPLARRLAELAGLPPSAVLADSLDLTALAALVASARLVLCGDTGIAHLASAYGTPSVLLFGPTPPAHWGPPPGPHTVLWSGRRGDPHGTEVDPGLLQIDVSTVVAAVDDRLARTGSSAAKVGEELPQVPDEQLRLLHGREVPAHLEGPPPVHPS